MFRKSFPILLVVLMIGRGDAQPSSPADLSDNKASLTAPQVDDPKPLTEAKRLVERPDERVSVLSNGLTAILKVHRSAPVVTVRMYCKTGSLYEQEYLGSGMSHLFEHLLHGSETKERSEAESRELLDAIGGYSNAYTSYDHTCYFINTTRPYAYQALDLLADWLLEPTWPQGAFDREWAVVQRELERDVDNPERQLFYLTMETLYPDHPARYPVIGYQPLVQQLTRENIINYHKRMYVPDNIVVCIAGDIDLDDTLEQICQRFAELERRGVPNIVLPDEPELPTPRMVAKRMEVQSATMRLAWPTITLTDEDLYALDVLSYVLTQGESARLVRQIRDKGLCYTIDSFSWTPHWGRGLFAITARLQPEQVSPTQAAILSEIDDIQKHGITSETLDQAINQKSAEHVFASQTAEEIGSMMARDYLATGDVHFSQAYVENIKQVTVEQVQEMARKYLVGHRLATVKILPKSPEENQAATSVAMGPGPISMVTLDNGLRCLLGPDSSVPLVSMQAFSLGGVAYENEQTNGLSKLASLVALRGTETRSAEEIARFFDARGGTLDSGSGNNTLYFQSQVLAKDFPESLDVFADVICHPSFPDEEIDRFRPRLLDAIGRINENWRSELFSFFDEQFYRESPYRFQALGRAEVIRQASRQQVVDFYRHQVTGPQTVVAIFGDIDREKTEQWLRDRFADLPSSRVPLPQVSAKPGSEAPKLFVKPKTSERQVAGIQIGYGGMKITDTQDRAKMAVLDTVISGYRLPTGWLQESLRGGDRSYVYEVHAMNLPGLLPGCVTAYAACQPEVVNEVYAIMIEQLAKARQGKVTLDELQRAKTIIVTAEQMDHQTNSQRAMQAILDELYGLGYDHQEKYLERIQKVSLEEVQQIAQTYLTEPTVTIVTPDPQAIDIGIEPIIIEDKDD